jgi:polysaccharide pyruvyl transferase WcaK-like protein
MRLHATILGAAAGRRVVAIAYDPKVTGFLRDMDLGDQVLPLEAAAADIAALVERSLADTALPARIAAGVRAARERTRAVEPALAALVGGRRG